MDPLNDPVQETVLDWDSTGMRAYLYSPHIQYIYGWLVTHMIASPVPHFEVGLAENGECLCFRFHTRFSDMPETLDLLTGLMYHLESYEVGRFINCLQNT